MTRRIELCALHRLRPHWVSCSTGVEAPLTREFQRRKRCSQQCSGSIKTCAWACARQSVLYPAVCAFARLAVCKTLATMQKSQLKVPLYLRTDQIGTRRRLSVKPAYVRDAAYTCSYSRAAATQHLSISTQQQK